MDFGRDIVNFVERWNSLYPIDHWWRKKYKVPFNSKLHQEQSILDMRIDYEEELLYEKLKREFRKEEDISNKYTPGRGIIFQPMEEIEVKDSEMDDLFDRIHISEISEEGDDGEILI